MKVTAQGTGTLNDRDQIIGLQNVSPQHRPDETSVRAPYSFSCDSGSQLERNEGSDSMGFVGETKDASRQNQRCLWKLNPLILQIQKTVNTAYLLAK